MDAEITGGEDTPVSFETLLKPFFEANSISSGEQRKSSFVISRPWNEAGLILRVKTEDEDLITALNAIYLPPYFSAIYHADTKDLEFIYSSVSRDTDLLHRVFDIQYEGQTIKCEWADASQRLMHIALAVGRIGGVDSQTNYRNLWDFGVGLRSRSESPDDYAGVLPPTSFWVHQIECDPDTIIHLANHISFYMQYYDRQTPTILVHEDVPNVNFVDIARYPNGEFPETLIGQKVDTYMLNLWSTASSATDPLRRFLHSYQIIEYAAYYYIKNEVRDQVRKALIRPNALSRIEDTTAQVIEAMTLNNLDDLTKLKSVLKDYATPELLWQIIEPNRDVFSQAIEFDGGFSLEALITPKMTLEEFKGNWSENLGGKLDKLRNVVLHSREKRHSSTIAPTLANEQRLIPWAELALLAAEQIMIFNKK